jgi:hypothetical protein
MNINNIKTFCKNYKWELIIGGCILLLIIIRLIVGRQEYNPRYNDDIAYLKIASDTSSLGLDTPRPPKKKKFSSERKCREIVERLLKKSFHNVRPDFLEFENGSNLELDMYNEELQLALEYQGVQHYKFSPYFHKGLSDFLYQQKKDDWKRKRCAELNIKLIEIPYTVKREDLEQFITGELQKNGIMV